MTSAAGHCGPTRWNVGLLRTATIVTMLCLATAFTTLADDTPPSAGKGFLDFNGYYDTRDAAVMTLNLLANLPARFQYFSLTNYSNPTQADQVQDLDTFYTEQNLRWAPHVEVPLDLFSQWVTRSGADNDILRLGVRWRLSDTPKIDTWLERIGFRYFVNFHLVQFDHLGSNGTRMQVEHVYRLPVLPKLLDDRVYVGGFVDHNLWFSGPASTDRNTFVTEHQLGVRLAGKLYAVAEFRRNEFLPSRKNGVGLGLEYVIPFSTHFPAEVSI